MSINGVSLDMSVINEEIPLGNLEVWTIINSSGTSHPFHVHGEPFQVLSRSDGPVPDNEKGWKDVVFVPLAWPPGSGNGWVKIIKPFNDFTDSTFTYMYHCHILEHEDAGMMGQYIVVDTATTVLPIFENSINTPFSVYPNPAKNSIWVNLPDEMNEDYIIEIKNSLGQLMLQSKRELSFDISSFPHGLYLISIQNKNVKATQKLIIQ